MNTLKHKQGEVRQSAMTADLQRIAEARHHDPHSVLGRHVHGGDAVVRVFLPHTDSVAILETTEPLQRIDDTDIFEWRGKADSLPDHYTLESTDSHGRKVAYADPYNFAPLISDFDLHLFGEGRHLHVYNILGAHPVTIDGIDGVQFATWAPNAERVSVIADFNQWDGRIHAMRSRGQSGIWEIFIPEATVDKLYKFEIRHRDSGSIQQKFDP